MIDSGFKTMITRISKGLEDTWLGQVLDCDNLAEFLTRCEKGGVNPMGEGGEYETMVIEGPNMNGRIDIEFETRFGGDSVELKIINVKPLKKKK